MNRRESVITHFPFTVEIRQPDLLLSVGLYARTGQSIIHFHKSSVSKLFGSLTTQNSHEVFVSQIVPPLLYTFAGGFIFTCPDVTKTDTFW